MLSLSLRRAGSAGALVLFSLAAAAQESLPFPLEPVSDQGPDGALELLPNVERLSTLAALDSVVFEGVPLPGGRQIDLRLTRVPMPSISGVLVDGAPAELNATDLTVWRGRIDGSTGSEVMLGLSRYGSRGWISEAGEVVHLTCGPDENGDWSEAPCEMWTESALNAHGMQLENYCTELLPGEGNELRPVPVQERHDSEPTTIGLGSPTQLLCRIAIETDYQLFQEFGDLTAEQVYMQTLLAAISDRYLQQIQTRIEYPYLAFYTNNNDPWVTNDLDPEASSGALLGEFRSAWAGSPFPGDAHLAHLISGEGSGGVAYVGVLCSNNWGFAVSGSINGNVNFPVSQAPFNWDFIVIAHELGHNYGTSHTHNYCPPIDECPSEQYWGACQDERICINNGTIMSYCHTCSGGTGNITTFFHPEVVTVMRAGAENSCLPIDIQSTTFCDASDGSLSACPCGQGNPNSGCETAQSSGGVELDFVAQSSGVSNAATFVGMGFPATAAPAVVVIRSSEVEATPLIFGDGLRCVGTPVVRMSGRVAIGGSSTHTLGHGDFAGSGRFYYQLWYRNTPAMFCSPDAFNLSNGRTLDW